MAGTILYRWLKAKTTRPRPYQVNRAIACSARPLDRFGFPSGHTLHAVAFSIIALAYFPQLTILLVPLSFWSRSPESCWDCIIQATFWQARSSARRSLSALSFFSRDPVRPRSVPWQSQMSDLRGKPLYCHNIRR